MRVLRLALLLSWPVTALAVPPLEDGVDVPPPPTMEDRQAAFGLVNEAFTSGRLTQAADLLVELSSDETQEVFHAEAYARLALTLHKLELPYSSLLAYEKALRADPHAVGSEVGKALALGEAVGDAAVLEPVFAENLGLDVDASTRSRMAYLAARENHRREDYALASAMLMMVQPTHPDYPEAQALQGVIKSLQGRYVDAIVPLQIALATGAKANRGARFESTVQLNIARAYFAAENFVKAIEYYVKIPRADPKWLEAQFERSWAHFRMQDMSGTLALLHNHSSPYFDDLYYPEGSLLRVYALFLLCKFPDASKEIEAFQSRYRAQHSRLMEVSAMRPRDLFDTIRRQKEDGESSLPKSVAVYYESEDRLADSLQAVRSAENELARLQNVAANPFSTAVRTWVEARRAALIDAEGGRIQARVQRMERDLGQMLADSDITKLDLLQMETRLYERASVIGEVPEGKRRVKRRTRARVGQRMWPWEGEFWADEVGYYRIDTRPDCPESMQAGTGS